MYKRILLMLKVDVLVLNVKVSRFLTGTVHRRDPKIGREGDRNRKDCNYPLTLKEIRDPVKRHS